MAFPLVGKLVVVRAANKNYVGRLHAAGEDCNGSAKMTLLYTKANIELGGVSEIRELTRLPEISVHGTYPFDSMRWFKVRTVTPKEAMELVQAEPEYIEQAPPEYDPTRSPSFYPWINKGYVLLHAESAPSISGVVAAFIEGQNGELGLKNLRKGQQAVYLHDGYFWLIEIG